MSRTALPSVPDAKFKLSLRAMQFLLSLLLSSFAFLALFFLFRSAFIRLYFVPKRSLEVILARVIKLLLTTLCSGLNLVSGFRFSLSLSKLIITHEHTQNQRKIKFKPRIILNHNSCTYLNTEHHLR